MKIALFFFFKLLQFFWYTRILEQYLGLLWRSSVLWNHCSDTCYYRHSGMSYLRHAIVSVLKYMYLKVGANLLCILDLLSIKIHILEFKFAVIYYIKGKGGGEEGLLFPLLLVSNALNKATWENNTRLACCTDILLMIFCALAKFKHNEVDNGSF